MTNKTCFSCIYSVIELNDVDEPKATLICWPSGNQEREQLSYKICDEYKCNDKKEISK